MATDANKGRLIMRHSMHALTCSAFSKYDPHSQQNYTKCKRSLNININMHS